MNRTQAEIIRQLLIDLNVGVVASYTGTGGSVRYTGSPWPVFSTNEPANPDNLITVYDTIGNIDGRDMFGRISEHLGFQVRVRAFGHTAGQVKAYAVRDALSEQVSQRTVAIGADRFFVHCCAKFGPVLALGLEAPTSGRSLFTVNATASIRQL